MSALEPVNSTILGAAAEHYVMCQLLRRNMIAALAPAGVPDADIIVSNRLGNAMAAVQVKARRDIGADGGWHMSEKHEKISRPMLFYAFVDFGKSMEVAPRSWVVPSKVVAKVITEAHLAWLGKPGAKGQARNPNKLRRFRPEHPSLPKHQLGWLDPYFEAWNSITPVLSKHSN